ncbi:MAG TPA: hypothetical protein VIL36_04325 [Acidimicrobiales bacterium]
MGAVEREWVSAGPAAPHGSRRCQGLYVRPAGTTRPRVAFVAAHYEVDFSEHYLGPLLAERGFGFLGWNTRYRGEDAFFRLDRALDDVGTGVRWLRESAGAEVLVLLGNSGGGSLMAAYQASAVADRAPEAATGDDPGRAPEPAGERPPGDLYVSVNAHPGRPEVLTAWLDPSVLDEADPLSRDPALDMFEPRHGPPYAPDFVARYRAAQVARNHRITAWARAERERLAAGGARDRLFTVHRAWADLRFLDLTIDPSDRATGCYAGDPERANRGPWGLARTCSLRGWLEMWSLEASRCRSALHLPAVTVPALVVQSLADRGVFPSDARAIHDALGTPPGDRRLELVPGGHYFEDGTADAAADLIAAWVAERT